MGHFYLQAVERCRNDKEGLEARTEAVLFYAADGDFEGRADDSTIKGAPIQYGRYLAELEKFGQKNAEEYAIQHGKWVPPLPPRRSTLIEREIKSHQAAIHALSSENKAALKLEKGKRAEAENKAALELEKGKRAEAENKAALELEKGKRAEAENKRKEKEKSN